jgi:hypothetical protein
MPIVGSFANRAMGFFLSTAIVGGSGSLSGGTVTNITGYEVHTFTASGTLTVTGGTATVEYLVAGGGGANGLWSAEDAGAGGLLVGINSTFSRLIRYFRWCSGYRGRLCSY